MKKRIFAGITASILALSCAAQVPAILSASAAGNYEMQLNIKLNGEKKAISPYIYGVNEAGNSTSLKKVTTHSLRQGGNRFTGYNWENNYSNICIEDIKIIIVCEHNYNLNIFDTNI